MFRHLRKFVEADDGPTAVEYAVLLALIVITCIGSVYAMSAATAESFDRSADELSSVLGS
jgi:pilus assembly protein Flp/PilA